ncbi:MAG: uracil-DNA glycosylase, partial [Endomicrobium sp.]|nr:uracil-DNA glycosylase [Endomicrobium sp.]
MINMKKYFKKLPEKLLEYIDILRLTELLIKECNNWGQSEICDTNIKISSDVSNRISQFPSHVKSQIILNNIKQKVNYCQRCQLWKSRLNPVFGTGIINADIMFVGEAPGYDEDHRGEPFVGKSGQLLTKIIEAMNYKRETVYISNIVKCHPMIDPHNPEKRSNDRPPTNVEMKACLPYLDMQIAVINPKIIVSLGGSSIKALTN